MFLEEKHIIKSIANQVEFIGEMLRIGESLADSLVMAGCSVSSDKIEVVCLGANPHKKELQLWTGDTDNLVYLIACAEFFANKSENARNVLKAVYGREHELAVWNGKMYRELRLVCMSIHHQDGTPANEVAKILRCAGLLPVEVANILHNAGYNFEGK